MEQINVMVMGVKLMCPSWKVSGSNLGPETGYQDWELS